MDCKLLSNSKFLLNKHYQIFHFSEPHPAFRKAFDAHIGHLAEAAYEFLRVNNGQEDLQLRKPKYRNLDKALVKAKALLQDFLEDLYDDEEVDMEMLLR